MPRSITITVPGAPRTKKNSPIIARFGKTSRAVLLPSAAYRKWHRAAMTYVPVITRELTAAGVRLPIDDDVNCSLIVYAENLNQGDLLGYCEGVADWLQSTVVKPDKRTGVPRVKRRGAGVINDDSQIRQWDGSRLFLDRAYPRVEITLTDLQTRPESLFDAAEESKTIAVWPKNSPPPDAMPEPDEDDGAWYEDE